MDLEEQSIDPKLLSKWKAFRDEVQTVLKAFDAAREWPDVMKCIQRLQKALEHKKYERFEAVPEKLTLCKRLAQCLNPTLPPGIHLTTLDVYRFIFKKIGANLAKDLPLYGMGLFPFFQSASLQVRPKVLELFSEFFVPLKLDLAPCLDGLVDSLLYGLEESNTKVYADTKQLLEAIQRMMAPEEALFFKAVWKAVYINPAVRISGFGFLTQRLPASSPSGHHQFQSQVTTVMLGHSPALAWNAFTTAILDSKDLVRRAALDCLTTCFRLHERGAMSERDAVYLMVNGLRILSLNEQPSLRRLYNWFYGGDGDNARYFDQHTRPIMVPALRALFQQGTQPKSDPFYVLMFLLSGKSRAVNPFHHLLPDVVWDVLCCVVRERPAGQGRGHRVFAELPPDVVFDCLRRTVVTLPLSRPADADLQQLKMISRITSVLPMPAPDTQPFDLVALPHAIPAAPDTSRSKKADGDSASEASVEEVEGEKRGGYLPEDTYAYCVAHLIVLVLSRARSVCSPIRDADLQLQAVAPLLTLSGALHQLLAAALAEAAAPQSEPHAALVVCAGQVEDRLLALLCQLLPPLLPLVHTASPAAQPAVANAFREACRALLALLVRRRQYTEVLPAGILTDDELFGSGPDPPAWLRLLLCDALRNTASALAVTVGDTVLRLLTDSLLPPVLHTTVLQRTGPLVTRLWELLGPADVAHHAAAVAQLADLHALQGSAVEDFIVARMVDTGTGLARHEAEYVRMATLWRVMDDLKLDRGAFGPCMCLLLDALRAEDSRFRRLAAGWLAHATRNVPRLLHPLFAPLLDREWDREGDRAPIPPLDHARTHYALRSLHSILEAAPRPFLTAAFATPSGQAGWLRRLTDVLVQTAKRDGRLLTGCTPPMSSYLAVVVVTLFHVLEAQLPPFDKDGHNARLYMAHRTASTTLTFREGVALDPAHLPASTAFIFEAEAARATAEAVPLGTLPLELAVRATECLDLVLRYAHRVGLTPDQGNLFTAVVAAVKPAVCLLLNSSVQMGDAALQAALLPLLVQVLVQLSLGAAAGGGALSSPSPSREATGSPITPAAPQTSGVPPTPVFLYPLLHGLACAGLRGSTQTLALWVDALSCLLPFAQAAMPKLTQGLVLAYCHIIHRSARDPHAATAAPALHLAFKGLRRLLFCLYCDDPVDLRAAGQRLLDLPGPSGHLYDEVFGGLTMVRPAPMEPLDGPATNGSPSPRDAHVSQSRDTFHTLLGHIIITVVDVLAEVSPEPPAAPSEPQPPAPMPSSSTSVQEALRRGATKVLDPLMRTQPFVLLRCIVRLLADQRSSIQLLLSDFAPAAQQFISVLNLLPSATAETVILTMVQVVQENASPAQTAPSSRLTLLSSEKPGSPIYFAFSLELVAQAFLTEYITSTPTDGLGTCRLPVFTAVREAANGTNGFTPSFALRLALRFLARCPGLELASAADDPRLRKLPAECVGRLLEAAVRMSLSVDPPCADAVPPDAPMDVDRSALALANLSAVMREGHQGQVLRAMEREERDKTGALLLQLLTNHLGPALRLKDNAARLRSTLRIRAAAEFLAVALQSFPQCVRLMRRELWEFVHDATFFRADRQTLAHWKALFALTVASDLGWHYGDLVTRFAAAVGGIFTGTDTVARERAQLIRRLAFTLLAAAPDSAQLLLQILDMLVESARLDAPSLTQQTFLCFRVLLFQVPPQNLSLFWPTMLHEMIRVLHRGSPQPREVVLEALKAVDLACVVLPAQFQTFKWIFVGEKPAAQSVLDRCPYQALITTQAGGKPAHTNAKQTKEDAELQAPMLAIPERCYGEVASLEVVAATVCAAAPFEPHLPYQPQPDAAGPPLLLGDCAALPPPSRGRSVPPADIEQALLGDLYDWTFFKP
eukprot:EG_transcript_136